jgi:cell volume regulation protein A
MRSAPVLTFPSELGDVFLEVTALAFVVAFVARPLAASATTAFDPCDARERLVIGWAGLRGAVPVRARDVPDPRGVSRSREFFNIALFAVHLSATVQGVTREPSRAGSASWTVTRRTRGSLRLPK